MGSTLSMGEEHKIVFGQGPKVKRAKSTLTSPSICLMRHIEGEERVLVALLTLSPCPKTTLCSSPIGGGTIPPDILVTAEKPDIVIIDPLFASPSGKPSITIIELTCPWEERLDQARDHKTDKYSSLTQDIKDTGHPVQFIPLEIGVRGIVNKQNKESIKQISYFTTNQNAKKLTENLSRQAVIASYYIFLNRNETDWNNNYI